MGSQRNGHDQATFTMQQHSKDSSWRRAGCRGGGQAWVQEGSATQVCCGMKVNSEPADASPVCHLHLGGDLAMSTRPSSVSGGLGSHQQLTCCSDLLLIQLGECQVQTVFFPPTFPGPGWPPKRDPCCGSRPPAFHPRLA